MIELAEFAVLLLVLAVGAWLVERPSAEQQDAARRNQAHRR